MAQVRVPMVSTEAPVCVIVVNYNGGSLLRRCVETLGGQTRLPQEIIIVDNGSADGSIASLSDLPVMKTSRVKIITPGTNLGFAAANNLGVSQAGTPWIATLNPDAFPEPEWLAQLMNATIRHPDAVMFGSTQLDATDISKSITGDPGTLRFQIAGVPFKPFYETYGRHSVYLHITFK